MNVCAQNASVKNEIKNAQKVDGRRWVNSAELKIWHMIIKKELYLGSALVRLYTSPSAQAPSNPFTEVSN